MMVGLQLGERDLALTVADDDVVQRRVADDLLDPANLGAQQIARSSTPTLGERGSRPHGTRPAHQVLAAVAPGPGW